jgi:cell division protein FtsB
MVKRYTGIGRMGVNPMIEHTDGDYVAYEDYKKLEQRIKVLEKHIETLTCEPGECWLNTENNKLKQRVKELEEELNNWKLGNGIIVEESYFNKLEKHYKESKGG